MTLHAKRRYGDPAANAEIGRLRSDLAEASAEIGRLTAAHQEIVRKYERIMEDPPDWTSFNGEDSHLKWAREAWYGAASISRKALGTDEQSAREEGK